MQIAIYITIFLVSAIIFTLVGYMARKKIAESKFKVQNMTQIEFWKMQKKKQKM